MIALLVNVICCVLFACLAFVVDRCLVIVLVGSFFFCVVIELCCLFCAVFVGSSVLCVVWCVCICLVVGCVVSGVGRS